MPKKGGCFSCLGDPTGVDSSTQNHQPSAQQQQSYDKTNYPQPSAPQQQPYGAPPQQQQPYGAPPQQQQPYDAPPPYGFDQGQQQGSSYGGPPVNYQQGYAPIQVPYVAEASYDAGARFDGIAQPRIPPPPPGCLPNAAQVAAQQGQSVQITQQKSNWLTGDGGGGFVLF